MNKLVPIILPLLETHDYRGTTIYQHSKLVDDLVLIEDFFERVLHNNNKFPCKESDLNYRQFCEDYGWATTVPRKTLFPDLEKMGLISRESLKKDNWDFVCLTERGKLFLSCGDKRICMESAHRYRKEFDQAFQQFIERMEKIVKDFGVIFWWEVWLCMRLDIDIVMTENIVRNIRKIYGYRSNKNWHIFTQKVTNDFMLFNKKGKKQNGSIDFHNIINKVTSFGIKASFFFFKVDGEGKEMRFKSSFNNGENKLTRKNKRGALYLKYNPQSLSLEYHHIIPFVNANYAPKLQELIDDDKNLIPLSVSDHSKFPNKNNTFLEIEVRDQGLRFNCIENKGIYIDIENIDHLNLDVLKNQGMHHNKELLKKIV